MMYRVYVIIYIVPKEKEIESDSPWRDLAHAVN